MKFCREQDVRFYTRETEADRETRSHTRCSYSFATIIARMMTNKNLHSMSVRICPMDLALGSWLYKNVTSEQKRVIRTNCGGLMPFLLLPLPSSGPDT
jgi:hypothetical protein